MPSLYFAEAECKDAGRSLADLEIGRKLTEEEAACLLARRGSMVLCCYEGGRAIAFLRYRSSADLALEEARRTVSCAKRIGEGWLEITSQVQELGDL